MDLRRLSKTRAIRGDGANSRAISLPSEICDFLKWDVGTEISMLVDNEGARLVLEKASGQAEPEGERAA